MMEARLLDLNNADTQLPVDYNDSKTEIIKRLKERAGQWVPELFPNGKYSPNRSEWCLANIRGRPPKKDGSCKIALIGDAAGCFFDFADADGDGPLATIREALQLFGDELWEKAREYANMRRPNGHNNARSSKKKDRTYDVQFILNHCAPATGTLAERYLNTRGVDLPATADILYHSSLTDYEAAVGRPAMVAIIRHPDTGDATGGIHRTYLAEDGTAKADMTKPKMMLGPSDGVVMLAPMTADGLLGIGEGIETSLAAAKLFGVPVWAALSTSGMIKFKAPPGLRRLVIFADKGKGGEDAAAKLRDRVARPPDVEVVIVSPISADDFAEDLRCGYTADDYASKQEVTVIPPPSSFNEIVAAAQTLTRTIDTQLFTLVMRGIAIARLDPMQRDQVFAIIKNKTGTGTVKLGEYLRTARRDVGELSIHVPAGAGAWYSKLQMLGETSEPKQSLFNTLVALRHHEPMEGIFAQDEFTAGPCMLRRSPYDVVKDRNEEERFPRALDDSDRYRLAEYLQSLGLNTTPEIIAQAVHVIAEENRFHPVREWLDSLVWDGQPRLDTWLIDYAGAEDTAYTRAVSARFLISAANRIHRPGCKADCALILEGKQGIGKSKALRLLFEGNEKGWFTDEIADLGTKDSAMQLRGVWCVELAELDALNRADIARLKAFMSRTNDRYRPPFGRSVVDVSRQCVFAGTVNDGGYLRDPSGGRRFWPVACGSSEIDGMGVFMAREQIWAEAMARFRQGEKWYLHESSLVTMATDQQADRIESDAWDGLIEGFLVRRFPRQRHTVTDWITVGEILEEALTIEKGKWGRSEQDRVSRYLKRTGWNNNKRQPNKDGTSPRKFSRVRLAPGS